MSSHRVQRVNRGRRFVVTAGGVLALAVASAVTLTLPQPVEAAGPSRTVASKETRTPFFKTLARVPGPGPQWHQAVDRYGRFRLHLPPDWMEVAPESYGEACSLVAGEAVPTRGFSANLSVQMRQEEPGYSLKESMVGEIADMMESGQSSLGYRVVEKAYAPLGGKTCLLIGGRFRDHGRELRNLQLRVVYRGNSYLFTFTCLGELYAGYEPLFARMTRTLVFERPDGTWPEPPPVAAPKPAQPGSPAPAGSPTPAAKPAQGGGPSSGASPVPAAGGTPPSGGAPAASGSVPSSGLRSTPAGGPAPRPATSPQVPGPGH